MHRAILTLIAAAALSAVILGCEDPNAAGGKKPTPDPKPAPPLAPDLVVTNANVRSGDETVETGEAFRVYVTVGNQGSAAAGSARTRYYQSSDATITTSDTELVDESTSALGPGEIDDESESVTAPSSAGTYYYGACVDAVSNESDTTNNCSNGVRVQVVEASDNQAPPLAPDLVVTNANVRSGDETVETGEAFRVYVTVGNQGSAAAGSARTRYYQSSDATITTSDTELVDESTSALGPGEIDDESESVTAPSSAGTYYYGACVDAVSNESDTTNNCSNGIRVQVVEASDNQRVPRQSR